MLLLRVSVLVLLSIIETSVYGGVIFSGSGNNPEVGATASGQAEFTISGNSLTLVLTNTTSPRTTAQGNALTGILFKFGTATPTLFSLSSFSLTTGSAIWISETASNTSDPLSGSWTDDISVAGYGVATTGFNGTFNGGSISQGNASPDFGIVAANTFNGGNVSFGGSQFPFIQNSLTFNFTGVSGITESQISNVSLLFGTDGRGLISATSGTGIPPAINPEPASGLICLFLGASGMCYRRFRVKGHDKSTKATG